MTVGLSVSFISCYVKMARHHLKPLSHRSTSILCVVEDLFKRMMQNKMERRESEASHWLSILPSSPVLFPGLLLMHYFNQYKLYS